MERQPALGGRAKVWSPSRIPPPTRSRKGGKEKERGAGPLLLVLIGLLPKGGGRTSPLWAGVLPSYGP